MGPQEEEGTDVVSICPESVATLISRLFSPETDQGEEKAVLSPTVGGSQEIIQDDTKLEGDPWVRACLLARVCPDPF